LDWGDRRGSNGGCGNVVVAVLAELWWFEKKSEKKSGSGWVAVDFGE
jgi:hypothetical protein